MTEAVFTSVVIDSGSRPRPLPRVEFVDHSTAEGLLWVEVVSKRERAAPWSI